MFFLGLRQGEITQQHLVQQLQNPAMQPRHREVLASILKLYGSSTRPTSPLVVPPDPTLIQQLVLQQQLRNTTSPLPSMHNGKRIFKNFQGCMKVNEKHQTICKRNGRMLQIYFKCYEIIHL